MGGVTALTVTATAGLTRVASSCDNGGPQALHFNANLNRLSVSGEVSLEFTSACYTLFVDHCTTHGDPRI